MPPLDPRSVANTILGLAEEYGFLITQLSLQKILYFVHGRYLTETSSPLMLGNFEAWRYGPVHPLIYNAFKSFEDQPIVGRAIIKNISTGEVSEVSEPEDNRIRLFIRETAVRYLKMTAGQLIDLSHAPNSPWDKLTYVPSGERRYGARISNEHIKERFRFHKISIGEAARIGEPREESPPTGN